jgi:phosphatidylglycerol---prolipoprotein diacylglyceryl transferase
MSAAVTFPFLHPVLLVIAGFAAVGAGWLVPPQVRALRWWPLAAAAIGILIATLCGLLGLVPWIGRLHLAVYAICMVTGFGVAYLLMRGRIHWLGVTHPQLIDTLLIAVVLGVVGARARYVYERWETILANEAHGRWSEFWVVAADLDRGGAVWYGGVALATIGVAWYIRRRGVAWLAFADLVLPALIGGLAVGRIGCFFNGCCYGAPTSLPWGVSCVQFPGQAVHPTQLYETVVCALLATVLYWAWGRRRRDGQITFWGITGYAVWRFCNEGLRGDHDAFAFGTTLTTSQGTSLWLVVAAVVVATMVGVRRRNNPALATHAALVPGSRYAPVPALPPASISPA